MTGTGKHWITAPAPRKGRATLTLAGSIVLHGAIIAVAALWPMRYTVPAKESPPTAIEFGPELPNDPASLPAINLVAPLESSEPPPMVVETATDAPPPSEELGMDIATPRPAMKTTERRVRSSRVSAPGNFARNVSASQVPGGAMDTGHPGAAAHWRTPQPPYPYALRSARTTGSGRVRITTDDSGRVVNVSMVQSTGNTLLDDNTVRFARTNWSGPPTTTVTVPITYQMR